MSKYTVMVVEDEELLLKAITTKLNNSNVETVSCTSGKQALDYLEDLQQDSELPDLIWLDYHLKDIDGLEFMTRMRQHNNIPGIPVVVISNSADDSNVATMLGLGAKKYFLKAEHRLDDLVEEVKKLISEEKNNG